MYYTVLPNIFLFIFKILCITFVYMKEAPKKAVKKPAPTPIRWPDDLLKKLKAQAEKENRPLSNMIVTIVKEYYSNKND